jgi:O-antigen ligase
MRDHRVVGIPPRWAEYAYYGVVCNSVFGVLPVPLLAAGLLAALAALCLSFERSVYKPISWAIACAVSFIVIKLVFHDESILEPDNRQFIIWLLGLLVVQSLTFRQGFFERFALVIFVIGVFSIPYLNTSYTGEDSRAGLDRSIGFANPNDLAAWFGFCCVYFIVFAMQTTRNFLRLAALIASLGCLFVVGITVSRSTIMAVAIAALVALRSRLKRLFAPLLVLTIILSVIFISGLFDSIIGAFIGRGMEETGRFLVWPLAIAEFINSPLIGVGAANIGTWVPSKGQLITPHNSFIYIALVAGVGPLLFYLAFWIRVIRGAFRATVDKLPEAPFLFPLAIYAFIISVFEQGAFMYPWSILILVAAATVTASSRIGRARIRKIRTKPVLMGRRTAHRNLVIQK